MRSSTKRDNEELREFSFNIGTTKPCDELQVRPSERRRTLRRMFGSRNKLRTRHAHSTRREPTCVPDSQFQLRKLKLPSPIASLCPDLWTHAQGLRDVSVCDDDVVLAELVGSDKRQNGLGTGLVETDDGQGSKVKPVVTSQGPRINQSVDQSPNQIPNQSLNRDPDQTLNRDPDQSQNLNETEPRRSRSLMFKPVLDVTAVGTLIDTISRNSKPSAHEQPVGIERPSRIMVSLKRVTRTRTGGKLLRRPHRDVTAGRVRPKSHEICAIDTVQDEQSAAPGFQAALAMAAQAPQKQTTEQNIEQNADVPKLASIAMSLQSTQTRQFLLTTPLGEFEVERTLGQGSYGKVKLMRSALTHEQYAVKIIRRHTRRTDAKRAATLDQRVMREANLASMLGRLHPHIVPLHDLRATESHFYLFYAPVLGPTLADRVGPHGMQERSAQQTFKCVCETVRFCHRYSVIHRDIKLENVLLDGQNKPMLIDFGLANFYGAQPMDTFCGSLPYTAPEILRGAAYTGPEVDVWSLGVLLYVMLTGRFPFDDPAQPANFERIMKGDFSLRPSLSRHVQDLIVRMLDPDSRSRISVVQVIEHPWLADIGAPDACCVDARCLQPTSSVRSHTLVIPGPRASRMLASEVATCLDQPLNHVIAHIDYALAHGTPAVAPTSGSTWSLSAPLEQWPTALHSLHAGPLTEVRNSPIVSVYALVLQQIGLRRYFLELPETEPGIAAATRSSSSRLVSGSNLRCSQKLNDQDQNRTDQDQGLKAAEPEPRSLASRFAAQITGLVSSAPQPTKQRQKQRPAFLHSLRDTLIAPSYMQPLSSAPELTNIPSLPDLSVRSIGALEHLHERIPLPHALSTHARHVVAQLSALLTMHEIAHTFVETQNALADTEMSSSLFSLARAPPAPNPESTTNSRNTNSRGVSLKSLLHVFASQSSPALPRPRIVHPHLHDSAPDSDASAVETTVPVSHMTSVVLAQYSPSLHRGRETEVVEYYSCAVRIELVRVATHMRPRFALLVERMTGHRGKFALFRLFLLRIVNALPDISLAV
ncbi:Serine/threonine-protein kinase [Coemansia sp. RSA 1199]|nr:Serine/threonine-protein kinase [Coemansia sp. RSA 1199]